MRCRRSAGIGCPTPRASTRWRACSRSPNRSTVQNAIAGVLIRADYAAISRPELVRTLREHRRKGARGDDVIDALIRRLQQQP